MCFFFWLVGQGCAYATFVGGSAQKPYIVRVLNGERLVRGGGLHDSGRLGRSLYESERMLLVMLLLLLLISGCFRCCCCSDTGRTAGRPQQCASHVYDVCGKWDGACGRRCHSLGEGGLDATWTQIMGVIADNGNDGDDNDERHRQRAPIGSRSDTRTYALRRFSKPSTLHWHKHASVCVCVCVVLLFSNPTPPPPTHMCCCLVLLLLLLPRRVCALI